MTRLSTFTLANNMDCILDRVAGEGERIVLQRRGKGLAALIPIQDMRLFQRLLKGEQEDVLEFRKGRDSASREGTVPLETVKGRMGL